MTKRLLALFIVLTLLLSIVPPVYAADGPCITASTASVTQGNSVRVYLNAQQFSSVGSVDFTLYYDADAMSVSSTSNGGMIDGSTSFLSVNTNIAGQITASAVTMDAFSDSGTLLSIYFNVSADAQAKDYPLELAVGNAYGVDLMPLSVSSVNGKITVTERAQEQRYFYLSYYCPNGYYYTTGDSFTIRLQNNYYYSGYHMASGNFAIKYDPELFRVDSVEIRDALKHDKAVWSINTDIAGTILISYASDSNVASYELFDIGFTVIGNTDTSSQMQFSASGVYDENLFAYAPYNNSTYLYLSKEEEVVDYPDLWLDTPRLVVGEQVTSTLMLQKGADVAAGDFVVTYDPTVLRCVSVTAAPGLSSVGGIVFIDDNYTDGTIEFPYVNSDGYDDEDIALVQIVWEPLRSDAMHNTAVPSCSMVYNESFKKVTLECVPETDCIYVRNVIDPFCESDGYTSYTCACGDYTEEDPVPMLGHDIKDVPAQDPTCTEVGWYAYTGCARCKMSEAYQEIPALGHDEIHHEEKPVSCLEIGWDAYVTCGRCDYSTYEEIAALGHRTTIGSSVWEDPLSVNLDTGTIPFTLKDGVYYSNNHTDGSFSDLQINVLHACTLTLVMGTGSEQNWDKLLVYHNGYQVTELSGYVTDYHVTLTLNPMDIVTIRYQKDGSVSRDPDQGWVELRYEQVLVDGTTDFPSEELESDCANGVICSYCSTVIKPPLPHNNQADFSWNDTHSACTATLTCNDCGAQSQVPCSVTEDRSDPAVTVHTAKLVENDQVFTDILRCDNYLVTFQNSDGTILSQKAYHYSDAIELPPDPQAPGGYVFVGWDSDVTACTGPATYTAVYELSYIRGDMNNDLQVTDADALYLLRHTLFEDRYPITQSGDVNGDSNVTDADALYLLRYTLFEDRYPLFG